MSKHQTDSSFFEDKVEMRINRLPDKPRIRVLDCYAGTGRIWREIKRREKHRDIRVTSIEIDRKKAVASALIGDNIRYMKAMDLGVYDVIDLDAYANPTAQASEIFRQHSERPWNVTVHCTFIAFPKKCARAFWDECAMKSKIVERNSALFLRRFEEFVLRYLIVHGVKEVTIRKEQQKLNCIYISFQLSR